MIYTDKKYLKADSICELKSFVKKEGFNFRYYTEKRCEGAIVRGHYVINDFKELKRLLSLCEVKKITKIEMLSRIYR